MLAPPAHLHANRNKKSAHKQTVALNVIWLPLEGRLRRRRWWGVAAQRRAYEKRCGASESRKAQAAAQRNGNCVAYTSSVGSAATFPSRGRLSISVRWSVVKFLCKTKRLQKMQPNKIMISQNISRCQYVFNYIIVIIHNFCVLNKIFLWTLYNSCIAFPTFIW